MENLDSSAPTPISIPAVAVRYGLLTGLVSVIVSLTLFLTQTEQSPARWLGLIVGAAGIYLAQNDFKKQNGGFLEYGQGLGIGTLLNLISGALNAVFTYFYIQFVDDGFIGRIIATARAEMEAKGNLTDEQIDQALAMTTKFTTPTMLLVFGILGAAFFGFLLSLLITLVTKHSRPEFE